MEKPTRALAADEISEIERILGCHGLVVDLRDSWGSLSNPQHRVKIRQALATYLAENRSHASFDSPSWASALDTLPVSPGHFISISHGYRIGGYALCEKSPSLSGLGFDLETLSRLTPAIVERISNPLERTSSPDPRFLWAAKEASFKAFLGPRQPVAITEIRIENWSSLGGFFHAFTALSQQHNLGRGVLYSNPRNDEVFAFFLGIAEILLT